MIYTSLNSIESKKYVLKGSYSLKILRIGIILNFVIILLKKWKEESIDTHGDVYLSAKEILLHTQIKLLFPTLNFVV